MCLSMLFSIATLRRRIKKKWNQIEKSKRKLGAFMFFVTGPTRIEYLKKIYSDEKNY